MKVKYLLLATFLYTVLTGLVTYPLFFNITKGVFGYRGDNMLYMHDIWVWSKNGSVDLGEIKYSKISTQPILDQSATLLSKVTGSPLVAYNILILFSFISTAILTFLVSFKITKNYFASFIAGLIFSFSPYHIRQAQNHLEISQIEVIPFYFLYLYEFAKSKNRRKAIITGLALAISTLTVNYYGFFLGLLTVIYILYEELTKKFKGFRKRFLNYVILFAVSAILIAGCNVNYIKIASKNRNLDEYTWKALGKTDLDYVKYAAKPWFYILPDIENTAFGQVSKNALIELSKYTPYYLTREFTANEHSLYIGIIPILLSGIALKFKSRTTRKFILIAIIFILISFPPYIFISMRKIFLPSFLLMKVFPMFRVYARAGLITLFFTAVTSATGLAILTGNPRKKLRSLLITVTTGILIIVEFYSPPKFEKLLPLPPEYSSIQTKEANTVLESPKLEDHTNTFYQIYHQKPVYFVRTDGHLEVDTNDLNAQLARSESNIPLIFRGDFQQIYFDHKINELGIDLQNPVAEEKSITKHLERVKRNVDIIKSAGLNEVFHYNETYLFDK